MDNVRTKIGEGGRVILPAAFRQKLHLSLGDDIILHIKDNEIHITTPDQALRKLQSKVKKYIDAHNQSISLADEVITMRRAETEHE
jgi:AbrB family looped-hinge helix DNA binding protein